jgi:transcription antitermination factor NusA-like protein
MNKRIRVIQWDEDKDQFIKNTFSPYQISNIIEKDGKITLEASDYKTRGMLIGRNASTLRTNETIIRRYFPIGELRVA